ncbi:MAG: type II TA system antitoxin MqsA family protein [Limnochordia bacterium]|jgi:putative zinc finger/helix-turn-helix YgiT family protein|nr:DUF4065 domain-containing protein [Limnochordia bacterium]
MRKTRSETKLCVLCMEEHEVDTVEVVDEEIFKGEEVTFQATYEYCSYADEYLETEEMIKTNILAMKDAYREKVGLLTSHEIIAIRDKYGISQKDFSTVLDWGKATITRYENHQVQDRAHDDVLRKIDADPRWLLAMLRRAKDKLTEKAYAKYKHQANELYKRQKNQYLLDAIYAVYADYEDEPLTGGTELNLNKVVEMINYFAANVASLHKVKLMKMLWYADVLHYKRHGKAMSGLVYKALPMGAVPEAHDQIISLEGITYDEVIYDDNIAYRFRPSPHFDVKELTKSETDALDTVICEVGHLNTQGIVEKMHEEEAYQSTPSYTPVLFSFAKRLSID